MRTLERSAGHPDQARKAMSASVIRIDEWGLDAAGAREPRSVRQLWAGIIGHHIKHHDCGVD